MDTASNRYSHNASVLLIISSSLWRVCATNKNNQFICFNIMKNISGTLFFTFVFLSLQLLFSVDLGFAQPDITPDIAKEYSYEDYVVQGYTKEEMEMFEHHTTLLGLAEFCGLKPEKEMNTFFFEWIAKKNEEGLPDLGMVFLDKFSQTAHEAKLDQTVLCEKVKQQLGSTNFSESPE